MKPQLLMLHGALSNSNQFSAIKPQLSNDFDCHCLTFPGHSANDTYQGDIKVETLTAFVLDYIEKHQLQQPHILGYSLGGYVALHLASQPANKVGAIYTLATHFYWDEAFATMAIKQLNADKMLEKVPAFAEQLQQTFGDEYWRTLLTKTAEMMTSLGQKDLLEQQFNIINNKVMIAVGELDKLVDKSRSERAAEQLPNGQFKRLSGGKHLFEQINLEQLTTQLKEFFA